MNCFCLSLTTRTHCRLVHVRRRLQHRLPAVHCQHTHRSARRQHGAQTGRCRCLRPLHRHAAKVGQQLQQARLFAELTADNQTLQSRPRGQILGQRVEQVARLKADRLVGCQRDLTGGGVGSEAENQAKI